MGNYLLNSLASSVDGLNEILQRVEDGELTKEIVADTIEALQGEISQKCDLVADTLTSMDSDMKALESEIKRLQNRKESLKHSIQLLKDVTKDTLLSADMSKLKTAKHTFSVCNAGGKQSLEITSEVPPEFCEIKLEPDTNKIRKALENGQNLDFAKLKERQQILKIK